MECLPVKPCVSPATSINRIADQGETKVLQMHPNLMRAARSEGANHQGCRPAIRLAAAPDRLKMGDCLTPSRRIDNGHPDGGLRIATDRGVYHSLLGRLAVDQRQIAPRHGSISELGNQAGNR